MKIFYKNECVLLINNRTLLDFEPIKPKTISLDGKKRKEEGYLFIYFLIKSKIYISI